ncbi:unnamed protein product [Chrysoparadoxa australica]
MGKAKAAAEVVVESSVPFYLWSLLIIVVWWFAIAAVFRSLATVKVISFDKVDKVDPRSFYAGKELAMKDTSGRVRRINAAHANTAEALVLWFGAVLLGMQTGLDKDVLNFWAKIFIAARILFPFVYAYADTSKKSTLRSLVWMVGFVSTVTVLYQAIQAGAS